MPLSNLLPGGRDRRVPLIRGTFKNKTDPSEKEEKKMGVKEGLSATRGDPEKKGCYCKLCLNTRFWVVFSCFSEAAFHVLVPHPDYDLGL